MNRFFSILGLVATLSLGACIVEDDQVDEPANIAAKQSSSEMAQSSSSVSDTKNSSDAKNSSSDSKDAGKSSSTESGKKAETSSDAKTEDDITSSESGEKDPVICPAIAFLCEEGELPADLDGDGCKDGCYPIESDSAPTCENETKVCLQYTYFADVQCITEPCEPVSKTMTEWGSSCVLSAVETANTTDLVVQVDDALCESTVIEDPFFEEGSCNDANGTYANGETWEPVSDCVFCGCMDGEIICSQDNCEIPVETCEVVTGCLARKQTVEVQCITTPCDPIEEVQYAWGTGCAEDVELVDNSYCENILVDPVEPGVICPTLYDPVCAITADGEEFTASNSCVAEGQDAKILYEGICETITPEPVTCEIGSTFLAEDGCNTCFCAENGLIACTEMACVTVEND